MSNYADATYGDAYFLTRLHSEVWDEALADDRNRALTMATQIINTLNFAGDKADSEQDNQFPRGEDTEIPELIKKACCEIALALLSGVDPEKEYENIFIQSTGYGGVRTTFDRSAIPAHIVAGVPSPTAWKLLIPFLRDPRELKLRRAE